MIVYKDDLLRKSALIRLLIHRKRSPFPDKGRLTRKPFVSLTAENLGENHRFYIPNRVLSHGGANPCLLQRRRGTTAVVDEENGFVFCFGCLITPLNNHLLHRHAFGKVSRLVDIHTTAKGGMVG